MNINSRIVITVASMLLPLGVFAQGLEGTVDWNRRVSLGFGISGQVRTVNVEVGDTTSAGSVLVELDTTLLEIALSRASNNADIRQSAVEEQMAVLARERTLYDEGSLSGVALEQVELELVRREFAANDAELDVKQAQYLLQLARLRAPFDAWVVGSDFTVGQFVNHESDEQLMMLLVEKGRYRANTIIGSEALASYSQGASLQVLVGDKTYAAVSSRIGLEPIIEAGQAPQYALTVEFVSDELIRPGTSCTVSAP